MDASEYIAFSNFNTDGVEVSDTLNDWRKKTNGVVEKINSVDSTISTIQSDLDAAEEAIASADINDNAIVLEKIEQVDNLKVLGNTSGSTGNVSEVSVLDEDTLSSDSATALATQQSIKAYVDSLKYSITYRNILATAASSTDGYVTSATSLHSSFNTEGIFDSDSSASPSTLNWSNILPITFASNVEKTIIRVRYNWDVDSNSEEMTHTTIVIDWENSKVSGSSITNYEGEVTHYLAETTIASSATEYAFSEYLPLPNNSYVIKIGITGSTKSITKFPWLYLSNSYRPEVAQIEIENHIRG